MQANTITRPASKETYWKGSRKTYEVIRRQIAERWGDIEAEKYDPSKNCFTFNTWKAKGYNVKKGEKALRSYTFVPETEITTNEEGHATLQTVASHPKPVCLFYILQVEKR